MSSSLPTLVVLDLDDTLYNYPSANAAGKAAATEALESSIGLDRYAFEEQYQIARAQVKERLVGVASSHSRLLYFKTMLEGLGIGGHFDLALQLERTYWQSYLRAMEPSPGSKDFLEGCRQAAIPVVIATDLTLQIQLRKVIQLGLLHFVHAVVTSEEVGSDKPNGAFFSYMTDGLDLDSSDTWVIGDDLAKDRAFAESAGAKFWHISASQASQDSFHALSRRVMR